MTCTNESHSHEKVCTQTKWMKAMKYEMKVDEDHEKWNEGTWKQ